MAFPFLALALAATAVGVGVQVKGQRDAAKASRRSEALRKRQADLESSRERRKVVRQAVIARSQALSGATAQGSQGGSGLQGTMGHISSQSSSNLLGINQGQEIGAGIFKANSDIASGQSMSALGSGISSLGQMGVSNFSPGGAGTRLFNKG